MDVRLCNLQMAKDSLMSKLRLTLTLLLSLSLSLLAWGPSHAENVVGPTNAILCSKTASATPTSATTTALVSGVAGQSIYICGWHVTSILNTTSTFQFEYGTKEGLVATHLFQPQS